MIDYDEGKTDTTLYYEIHVGYSSETRFENFFTFRVNKGDCKVYVNDPDKGLISLQEWEKNIPIKQQEYSKTVELPVSIKNIDVSVFPLPGNFKSLQLNNTTPDAFIKLDGNIAILYFGGDMEKWYLIFLDHNKIKSSLLIGKRETVENSSGETTDSYLDFTIDIDLNVKLEYSSGKDYDSRKIEKEEHYQTTSEGKFEKVD
ncbi:hypothetical protein ACTHGU_21510 [Chitinophagaceae bacterium MMS25-I14]